MPGRIAASPGERYACKCLNIRVQATASDTAPPESPDDPAYSKVYAGDSGILVKHNHLTLRSRQRIAPAPGANRYSRYTTVSCLLCDLAVYRIFQVVPADVEGRDGPIIPAEDWVEKETMKSVNGWIEVNNACLTGDAIIHAEASSSYSSLLSVVVPPAAPQVATLPEKAANGSSEEEASTAEAPTYLSHIKPLFPPPPFTPSHPAFLHLASIAGKRSQEIREAAEKYVTQVVQQKTEEVTQADAALRKEVDAVWRKFRDSWRQAHDDGHVHHHHNPHHTPLSPRAPMSRRSSSRSRERDISRTPFARNSSPSYGTPIAIRDFVPSASVIERRASSPPPRQSSLSASLATTTFHHPRARAQRSPPPDEDRRGSPDSVSSRTLSTRSGSVTLVQPAVSESINVLQFRRNVDDTINTNATYRYFVIEEEMSKEQERRQQSMKPDAETSSNNQESKPSAQSTASSSNHHAEPHQNGQSSADKSETQTAQNLPKPQDPPTPSRGRDPKGKRKVTFDVKPDVVTIKGEGSEASAQAKATDLQDATKDMIFELEDMESDKASSPRPAQALPLLEQPAISRPNRPTNGKTKMKGLPESFASLRPSSLPNPSQIRRSVRSSPGADSSYSLMLSLPQSAASPLRRGPGVNGEKSAPAPEGAGTNNAGEPPHRLVTPTPFENNQGAWSADGRTWHTYTRGHVIASSIILEEKETDEIESQGEAHATADALSTTPTGPVSQSQPSQESHKKASEGSFPHDDETLSYGALGSPLAGVPGSLPVHIHLRKPREPLSLASYQPQHAMPTLDEQVPTKPNGKPMSSTAIRKAMYAERDRSRSVDPGLMDLLEEEEDESEIENVEENAKIEELLSTTRGRKRALKILQAANQLPEAGMWRSLAS